MKIVKSFLIVKFPKIRVIAAFDMEIPPEVSYQKLHYTDQGNCTFWYGNTTKSIISKAAITKNNKGI